MMRIKRWLILLMLVLCFAPVGAKGALSPRVFDKYLNLYSVCEKGDRGNNVLKVKERLQTLGYYRPTATFGDDFNDTMVQRVKLFQENNSLEVTGEVDSRTVEKLKEINPIRGEYFEGYWTEPDVALIIPENTYGQWNEKSGDRFSFRIKVKNVSTSRTVIATEYYVYTEDIWGNELISRYDPYVYSLQDTKGPGVMGYTSYMNIPYRRDTYKVHIAIGRVRYSDGTIKSLPGNDYYTWTIKW